LGAIAGLCQYDVNGNPRNVIGCSSLAVKEVNQEGLAQDVEVIKSKSN